MSAINSNMIPMPMKPSTMPAVAMPRPLWQPPDASISLRAMNPKIKARIEPIP